MVTERESDGDTANPTLSGVEACFAGYDQAVGKLRETHELELKLEAPEGFTVPELPGEALAPRSFTSSYFDTADRALAREGITLRRRVENGAGAWQLKLPRANGSRLELEAPGGSTRPPDELARLLTGILRGRPLERAAVLRTRREGVRVEEDGRPAADVVLDRVAVMEGRRVRARFAEVEVEALDGGAAALPGLERALLRAGAARGDGRPKAFRALELAANAPRAAPARSAPAREHVRAALEARAAELRAHDPGTRLGTDPEELHKLRVATRRLRAVLRAARPLLDAERAEPLRAELRWLAGVLAPVRDGDVLLERLRGEVEQLDPPERRAAEERLLAGVSAARGEAREAMLEAMSGERYATLLAQLDDIGSLVRPGAADALEDIAAGEFRKLRKAVRALPPEPTDDELHAVRIRGKRARYAAELAAGGTGGRVRRLVREAKRFQDVVGEHQDAVVAEERLRELAGETRSTTAHLAAGRLIERERERRRAARAAFPGAWSRLAAAGKRAWA
jgi:CHAD domain-containing protein